MITRILVHCLLISLLCFGSQNLRANTEERGQLNNSDASLELEKTIFTEANGKVLRWKLNKDDVIEVKKISDQYIEVRKPNTKNKVINRQVIHWITLKVLDKDNKRGYLLEGDFNSQFRYERNKWIAFQADENHTSKFYLQPRGIYDVDPDSYMPNIRNVPTFPASRDPKLKKNKLKPRDTWVAQAVEILAGEKLYTIPVKSSYEYLGKSALRTSQGLQSMHKIRVHLEINANLDIISAKDPKKVFGYASLFIAWDEKKHMPYYIKEDFNLILMYKSGETREFQIKSESYYKKKRKFTLAQKKKLVDELNKSVNLNVKQPMAKMQKKSISLELPDLFFETNSYSLGSHSKIILKNFAKVLTKYPKKRILIHGHTDNKGSADHNLKLSQRRALTVLQYLMKRSHLPSSGFSYKGFGNTKPITSNKTPEGRMKNRRVEIQILDD